MKKLILAASAMALGTAASANEPQAHDTAKPMTHDQSIAQPAPVPSNPEVMSQAVASYDAEMRATYPVCTMEIRDNCVQRNDPGGANLDLAARGTLGVNGIVYGAGGPDIDKEW